MRTIRFFGATILLGLMASCGYSVKSDTELRKYDFQVVNIKDELDEMKAIMQAEKDSLRADLERKQIELNHYKDSVAFMELDRQMCYTTTKHRHSCEIYK